ncbi:hypothetical protein [Desulfofalx alkaliphila]|uniref:hypothetical protein n=1 Tax=Desulfofalx alkaliphila TaxID=105483 RepID=UPI0004E0F6BB|nr:hypothetical protein [Desulfofalx alkaliphila]
MDSFQCEYLTAYVAMDNEDILLNEMKKFKEMAQRARERGMLSATEFEFKLLKKALEEGPEKLVQTIKHITPEPVQQKMMRLGEQAQKFLPFVVPDAVLSDWAIKQINRYYVKGLLRGECEIKLQNMVQAMTDSFVVNAMIESTKEQDDWNNMVEHIKKNFNKFSLLRNCRSRIGSHRN